MRQCLFHFFSAQSNVTDGVLEAVAYEARRLFRDRLVSSRDLHTFDNILSSIIRGEWGSDVLDNMSGTVNYFPIYLSHRYFFADWQGLSSLLQQTKTLSS